MSPRIAGFRGEYLWELDIARTQLLALAEAVPEDVYRWSPAPGTRPFSAVLVHIASGNFALLHYIGKRPPRAADLYGELEGDPLARLAAVVRKNVALEKTVSEKRAVIDLLTESFDAARQAFADCAAADLEETGDFFGERTTVRRVFLRLLAHAHEHMGQAIAYARSAGLEVPWPDPLKEFDPEARAARQGS
jgi:uncharacterized damage-inducible protein DinB